MYRTRQNKRIAPVSLMQLTQKVVIMMECPWTLLSSTLCYISVWQCKQCYTSVWQCKQFGTASSVSNRQLQLQSSRTFNVVMLETLFSNVTIVVLPSVNHEHPKNWNWLSFSQQKLRNVFCQPKQSCSTDRPLSARESVELIKHSRKKSSSWVEFSPVHGLPFELARRVLSVCSIHHWFCCSHRKYKNNIKTIVILKAKLAVTECSYSGVVYKERCTGDPETEIWATTNYKTKVLVKEGEGTEKPNKPKTTEIVAANTKVSSEI